MAINYPTSLDVLTNPVGTDDVSIVLHAEQHATVNDIAEALEAKVGIGVTTPTTDTILCGTAAGTSVWKTRVTEGALTGAQNGSNKTFTIPNAPSPVNSFILYKNGQRLRAGGNDYTLTGTTITMVLAPFSDDYLTYDQLY